MIKVYYLWATWCKSCNGSSPIIDELKELYPKNIFKINIEEQKDLAVKFQVRSIPTIVVVNKDEFGEEVIDKLVGNPGKAKLFEFVKKHLDGK